jgi:Flp pilus assembly protein TadB
VNARLLRVDVLIAAGIALVVLIVTPGLVVAAVVGIVALLLLALIAAAERRRSRARARSRQARRRPSTARRVR